MADENEQNEVFISYASANKALAHFLCDGLEINRVTCWIAPRNIKAGDSWAKDIAQGISDAKVIVLLVSNASLFSKEVIKEINLANNYGKITIPLRIEDVPLKGDLEYHLSNKQWVDAMGNDEFTRFDAAIEAILKTLSRDVAKSNEGAGSLFTLMRVLANDLNQQHKPLLTKINTMFRVREKGAKVSLFFPIRIGATGSDLIFRFDGQNKAMELYAHASFDGDPIKNPFTLLLKNDYSSLFPGMNFPKGARRWRYVELIPPTALTNKLADATQEKCFEMFKENIMAFICKVLPRIIGWVEYAREVESAIEKLEAELKTMFPEDKGWRIGAPEGERLNGYRAHGKINVYKKDWLPTDDYRGRGLLSITLESGGAFLDNIYIGILKYEPWLELGEFRDRLIAEGNNKGAGQTETPEDLWPWWQRLDEQWRSSGIGQAETKWKDKLKEFVDYCLARFENIKKLEHLLDDACAAIPELQIKDPVTFPPEMQQKWASSSFYIQNCMRVITEDVQKEIDSKYPDACLQTGFRFRDIGNWNDVYLKVKVENFDAAIAFKFYARAMKTEFVNLEPPDFETPVLKNYFAKRNSDKVLQEIPPVSSDCDGGTVSAWMERFQQFVTEKLIVIVPELVAFKTHLENVVALTKLAEQEIISILNPEDGWMVTNEASSLEKSKAITFYRKSWLRIGAQPKELPPLVFQIYADGPCFDNLYLAVKHEAKALSELERKIGAVCGACDFAFGAGDSQAIQGIWSRKLDTFHLTGGSSFERPLIDGDERSSFAGYLRGIAEQVKKMEPIIAGTCQLQHDLEFVSEIKQFINTLADAIRTVFPDEEGWLMTNDIPTKTDELYIGINYYKKTWQVSGHKRGDLSFALEGQGKNFDNLIYGVLKASDKILLSKHEKSINETCVGMVVDVGGIGSKRNLWPWYQPNGVFKTTGGANRQFVKEEKLAAMKEYYLKVFKEMKEKLVPVIDTIYPDKNAVKQQLCQKPADELKDMPDTMVNNNG